jgi:cytochrome bd-type quinol oxidase subunit 1
MHSLIATPALGVTELLIVIVVMVVIYAIPILVVIWFAKRNIENKRENVKLRLEVGRLAEELEQIRKKQQPNKP